MHDRTSASRPSRRPQRPCKCGTTHAAPRVACVGSRAHRSRRRTPRPHEHERRPSDRHLWARTAVATPCALSPLPVPHACTRSDDQRSSALQLARGRPCASDTAVVRPPRPARGAPRPLAEAAPGSPAQPPLPPTQWRRGQILHQTDGSAGVGGAVQRISEGHVKTLLDSTAGGPLWAEGGTHLLRGAQPFVIRPPPNRRGRSLGCPRGRGKAADPLGIGFALVTPW
jgi:hypothetical protein